MESVGLNNLKLTEEEKVTKEFLFRLLTSGESILCDTDLTDFEPQLPSWYDDVKYKRGQNFFQNNRAGIFGSNTVSLIALLTQEKGLKILCSTGRSSTADTARKRYASTILHTLSWYEHDLVPGSKSWDSLMRVRKMHLRASQSSERKNIGAITQATMAVTQFGFMGFALIRPDMFNINDDNEDDVEAFVHLWAVLGYMLGIKDEYNICLFPVNTVKVLSKAILRYFIFPTMQLETPRFKAMTTALLDGLLTFIPHMTYDLQIFLAKRVMCIPGYQYCVDHDKQVLCRSIFTENEVQFLLKHYEKLGGYEYSKFTFFTKVPVYNFTKNSTAAEAKGNILGEERRLTDDIIIENCERRPMDYDYAQKLRRKLGLDQDINITLSLIDYETEWKACLSDSKFSEMSVEDQRKLAFREHANYFTSTRIGHYIFDWVVSFLLWRIQIYTSA